MLLFDDLTLVKEYMRYDDDIDDNLIEMFENAAERIVIIRFSAALTLMVILKSCQAAMGQYWTRLIMNYLSALINKHLMN